MTKIFPHCTISVGLAPLADYKCAAVRRSGRGLGNGGGEWSGAFSHGGGDGVESDSVGPSPMVTEVGRYAQSSRPDGQLSQHL